MNKTKLTYKVVTVDSIIYKQNLTYTHMIYRPIEEII